MDRSWQLKRSDLFLVRLWTEEKSGGETEWHGRVQRTVNGETGYFRDWPQLVELLLAMVQAEQSAAKTQQVEAASSPEERL